MMKTPTTPPTRIARDTRKGSKNIGAFRYNQVYRQQGGKPVREHSDEEILTVLLGSKVAARSVLEEIGSLESYSKIREGRRLMHYPGVNKGTALKIDMLFEAAVRIG